MNTSLHEYVRKVCELEKYLYTHNLLLSSIDQEIQKYQQMYQNARVDMSAKMNEKRSYLPVDYNIRKPELMVEQEPDKPIAYVRYLVIAWIIVFVVGSFGIEPETAEGYMLVVILAIFIIIIGILGYIQSVRETKYNKLKEQYEVTQVYKAAYAQNEKNKKINAEVKSALEKEKAEAIGEYRRKIYNLISLLQNQRTETEVERNKITQKLESIYAENIIYPKYRSIIPMFMFQEYLDSKRCDALEGHEGAYNIYEQEIRANIIISQLDSILSELEDIRSNQYSLYAALNDSIHSTNRIMTSMQSQIAGYMEQNSNQMEVNQALLEYNNKVSTHMLDLMYWGKP